MNMRRPNRAKTSAATQGAPPRARAHNIHRAAPQRGRETTIAVAGTAPPACEGAPPQSHKDQRRDAGSTAPHPSARFVETSRHDAQRLGAVLRNSVVEQSSTTLFVVLRGRLVVK